MHNEVLEGLTVVKRSGQRVSFNASKVAIAIKKAFDSTNNTDDKKVFKIFEKVLNYINDNFKDRKTINVEDIQDIIENVLYNEKCYNVYNSFKEYRQKRALSRKVFAEKQQHKFVKAIERIEETSLNNDNSKSADELIFDFGTTITSEYTKSYVLDTKSVRAQEEGIIYIHDLDYFTLGLFPNIHLKLNNNFESIDSLLNEIINVEREIYGEIGIGNIDYLLEPFILKQFKNNFATNLKKYLKLMGFLELININKIDEKVQSETTIDVDFENYEHFFTNQQLKTIFEFAKEESNQYIKEFIKRIILNIFSALESRAEKNTTYTISFGQNENHIGKMINQTLYKVLIDNYYSKLNLVIKIKNTDMDLISKISKVFENYKEVGIQLIDDEKDIEYFIDGVKIYENTNSNESMSSGRMIVSSTSINLARLGLKYKNKDIKEFYEELESVTELVKNELLLSFETIGGKSKDYYRSLFRGNVYDDEKLESGQKIRKVIKNGVLNIGLIGLNECIILLEINENKRLKLVSDILDYLNDLCSKFTKETKLNFAIFEPVNKEARKSLLAIDKAIYGIVDDVTDKKRYDLFNISLNEGFERYKNILPKFKSGKLVTVNIPGIVSIKKIADTLDLIKTSKISFVKIIGGKNEY